MHEFIHPDTGEVLATQEEWQQALDRVASQLGPIYRELDMLREARAERFEPAALPDRRRRTDVQERVERCPRCGQRLEDE